MPTNEITFYMDENVDGDEIRRARGAGVKLITAGEAGNLGANDPAHFRYALEHDYVLVTANVRHFEALFYQWAETGRDHPGLVLISAKSVYRSGSVATELRLLYEAGNKAYMRNRVWRI